MDDGVTVQDYLVYGAITLRCVEKLIATVVRNAELMIADDGPHWRCAKAVALDIQRRIEEVSHHIKIKRDYSAFTNPPLTNACSELETIVGGFKSVLDAEVFKRRNYAGEKIVFEYVRRYEPLGFLQTPSGRGAADQMENLLKALNRLKSDITGQIKPILTTPGNSAPAH